MLEETIKFIKDRFVYTKKKKSKKTIRGIKQKQKKVNKRCNETHQWIKL